MDETIAELDSETAVRILLTIAKAETRRGGYETRMNAELGTALSETLGGPEVSTPLSEGELARQALLLLSEDPFRRASIEALIHEPPPEHFGVGTTIALVAALLFVLQTRFEFERDKDGRYTIKVQKKPTSESLFERFFRNPHSVPIKSSKTMAWAMNLNCLVIGHKGKTHADSIFRSRLYP